MVAVKIGVTAIGNLLVVYAEIAIGAQVAFGLDEAAALAGQFEPLVAGLFARDLSEVYAFAVDSVTVRGVAVAPVSPEQYSVAAEFDVFARLAFEPVCLLPVLLDTVGRERKAFAYERLPTLGRCRRLGGNSFPDEAFAQ